MPAPGAKPKRGNAPANVKGKENAGQTEIDVGEIVASTMKDNWQEVWKASYADRKINKDVSIT